jgi:redox-sensitive bicupin YhaK (pirin superfamily)
MKLLLPESSILVGHCVSGRLSVSISARWKATVQDNTTVLLTHDFRHEQRAANLLHKSTRTTAIIDQGPFVVHVNMPGRNAPGHDDYGYGPLVAVAESYMAPDTYIGMHAHVQDEIISYVPQGVMRHGDLVRGKLITDRDHLMVMNAGRGFWHEERTLAGDPPLRMLQIFVRPHTVNLEPGIQHGRLEPPIANAWRHLVGPEGGEARFFVRNDVHLFDIRLDEGASARVPAIPGWSAYFYVYSGLLEADGETFVEGESGLAIEADGLTIAAKAPALLVAFLIDPKARITTEGNVGDGGTRALDAMLRKRRGATGLDR